MDVNRLVEFVRIFRPASDGGLIGNVEIASGFEGMRCGGETKENSDGGDDGKALRTDFHDLIILGIDSDSNQGRSKFRRKEMMGEIMALMGLEPPKGMMKKSRRMKP